MFIGFKKNYCFSQQNKTWLIQGRHNEGKVMDNKHPEPKGVWWEVFFFPSFKIVCIPTPIGKLFFMYGGKLWVLKKL